MSLNDTIPVDLNPPVAGGGDIDIITNQFFQQLGLALALCFVIGIIVFYLLRKNAPTGADIDPNLDDLMSDPYDPNRAAIVMMGLMMPLMLGVIYGLQYLFIDLGIGMSLIVGSVAVTLIPYYMMKQSSRDKTRNMKKMEGTLYTKSGKKRKYLFSNVDFDAERTLNDADRELIIEADNGVDKEILDKLHPVPALINSKYNVYFLFEGSFADAIVWMNDDEFDYYGSYTTKADGPVLKEVCKIQRVQKSLDDSEDFVNEFTYVFWVMFDDSHALKRQSKQEIADLTNNDMYTGITKLIGVDRKVISGEINAVKAELKQHQEHGINFDDVVKSVARKKALELRQNEDSLTNIDLSYLKGNITIFTALVFAFATFVVGLLIGG